ncbi:MAG: ABC transporter substrate-binding protein [Betaproteobacteria bacterium HGW-Betaproteobacteria-22]|nr:MAG: ABC transporter substrate-binding protein [Betaproteobacteria bacterium HGW-Betaproteobacteria-22]
MNYFNFKSVLMLLTALLVATLSGCAREGENSQLAGQEKTELRYQWVGGFVSFPELAEELGYLGNIKLNYVGSITGGPQDLQALATGDVDFATAFNGAIVKLAVSGVDIVSLVGSYGSDENTAIAFFVTEDSPIKTARDLIGKKISVNTLGAHSEFTIKEYLYRNGLTKDEVEQVELTVLPPVNSEQSLRAGQVDVAQLNGILKDKALARGGIRQLFADIDLFGDFTAGNYVVTKKFLAANPNTTRQFVEGTARAIEWARNTPREEVIAKFTSIINKRGRNEDARLVQFWKSTGIADKGGLITEKQYEQWIDWLVRDGQLEPGKIKAKDLIDNSFNPYLTEVSDNAAQASQ